VSYAGRMTEPKMTYLAPLSNQELYRLRQVMRGARDSADLCAGEDMTTECCGLILDTYLVQCSRLPNVCGELLG
jgi:hypothetical protein